jgi:hypothetical protein
MKTLACPPVLRLGLVLLPIACGDSGGRDDDTAGQTTSATNNTTSISATDTPTAATVSDSVVPTTDTGGSMSQTGTEATVGTTNDPSATGTESTTSPATITATDTGTTNATNETIGESSGSSSTGEPCVDFSCSDDNQSVLCAGEVVEVCSNGNYCVDSACVPLTPCEAAELFQSSEGCEYYAVKSELISDANGSCFAAFVANTSDQPVKLTVEYNGAVLPIASFTRIPSGQGKNIVYGPYDANAGLPVGEVAIMFLSRGPGGFPNCPAPAGILQETHVVGTGFGKAFRISTDYPVAAYQMLPYGGGSVAATSATLLLPTSVWDVNYIAINAYLKSQIVAQANPLFSVVGQEDGTEITIDPKVAIVGGNGVAPGPAGVPAKYMINRGQTLQFSQPQELTGSPIVANKPFGMFGGASCLNVLPNATACDGAHQQIPPVKALGNNYAAIRYRNRVANNEESPPWRLVGAVADTNLTYIPAKPNGAPDVLTLGQVVEFNAPGPFIVASQDLDHPFYFAAYMTGGANYGGAGDPEWVNVIPTAQYLDEYVLFTDPTYPETSLVVVRNKKDGAFADVNLACAGNIGNWTPLGQDQEWTRVDLVTGNFQDQGNCSNGRHEMKSDNPFGVTVWGWGSNASQGFNSVYVSYAYPAGAAIKSINDVIILPQ